MAIMSVLHFDLPHPGPHHPIPTPSPPQPTSTHTSLFPVGVLCACVPETLLQHCQWRTFACILLVLGHLLNCKTVCSESQLRRKCCQSDGRINIFMTFRGTNLRVVARSEPDLDSCGWGSIWTHFGLCVPVWFLTFGKVNPGPPQTDIFLGRGGERGSRAVTLFHCRCSTCVQVWAPVASGWKWTGFGRVLYSFIQCGLLVLPNQGNTTPSVVSALRLCVPSPFKAETNVASMAKHPPHKESPSATTSSRRESVLPTGEMSRSRKNTLVDTLAPPSRQICATAFSTANPLPSTPAVPHTARWWPMTSRGRPHRQDRTDRGNSKRKTTHHENPELF